LSLRWKRLGSTFFARNWLEGGHPVLLTGFAGTGKSIHIRNLLNKLDDAKFMYHAMNFNDCTTLPHLQIFLEAAIEMKSGRPYAPPAQRTCIYFIDHINMPDDVIQRSAWLSAMVRSGDDDDERG
jgi:dynein heavy chain